MKTYVFRIEDNIEINENLTNKNVLIQVFCGKSKEEFQKAVKFLSKKFPKAFIIGTSTDGEIYQDRVLERNIVVAISIFEKTSLKLAYADRGEPFANGVKIAKSIITPDTKLIISFADGINCNGEEYLNGIYSVNKDVKIAGGLAGDNGELKETFLAIGDKIYSTGAVGVSLNSKDLKVKTLYNFGWEALGIPHKITKSEKNRVYKIDDMSAVDFYTKYLGEEAAKYLPAIGIEFPLILKKGDLIVARAVIKKHDDGSLSFAGNVPEGSEVYIGVGDKNKIISTPIKENMLNVETFFVYSCMARRRFLLEIIENELRPFAFLAPTAGFFTYGEFFTKDRPYLFNETLTAVALSENENVKPVPKDIKKKSANMTFLALVNILDRTSKELIKVNNLREKDFNFAQQAKLIQMGEMVNMIAHQWRQPLNAISAAAIKTQMQAEMGLLNKDEIIETMKFIENTAQHMSKIINDFMNFTKPTHNKECVKFSEIINNILNMMSAQLKNHNIELRFDYKDEKILTFTKELEHILINLLANARDALDEKNLPNKQILVKAYKKEKDFIIEVIDNAGGVPQKIIDRIFEPYFTTKEEGKGTGLGLYMSKKILNDTIGGDIKVENVDNGAKFTIILKDTVC